jgi:hypothetical protein
VAGLLLFKTVARSAHPLTGGYDVTGACFALPLDAIHQSMSARRDRLAQAYGSPPDPASLPGTLGEGTKRRRLEHAQNRHQEFLRLSAVITEVGVSVERGENVERSESGARFPGGVLERWGAALILHGQYLWVECRACGRRYLPEECGVSDWSTVTDPLVGVGGKRFACPTGHTLFVRQTWVA